MTNTITKMAAAKPNDVCNAEHVLANLPNALFFVERNLDSEIVVYNCELNPAKDEVTGVHMYWSKYDNLSEKTNMGETAKNMFYGVTLQKIKRGVHRIRLACTPEDDEKMFIDIRIKKSGNVQPHVTIDGKDCKLLKIYTDLTRMPPKMNALWVVGKFKDEILYKQIPIDSDSMIERLDMNSFFPSLV